MKPNKPFEAGASRPRTPLHGCRFAAAKRYPRKGAAQGRRWTRRLTPESVGRGLVVLLSGFVFAKDRVLSVVHGMHDPVDSAVASRVVREGATIAIASLEGGAFTDAVSHGGAGRACSTL